MATAPALEPETLVVERPSRTGPAVRLEGGIFGPDILERLAAGDLPGQRPADFGIRGTRSVTDEAAEAYRDARDYYRVFRRALDRLPPEDPATTLTRERWVIPLLGLLGYELHYNSRAYDLGGQSFPISHRAGENDDAPPVHIVGAGRELGRADPNARPRVSPHALMQEFLNRSSRLWGIVTNGRELRLLRESSLLHRQAYVAFDLEAIFSEDEDRFSDFLLLWRLLHRTRLPHGAADAHECLLEQYHQQALEQGSRARDRLRDGVERCLELLGTGFLRRWEGTKPAPDALYHDLLRLVYRFLFLLVAEERGLLAGNDLYREHYSVSRLRRLVDRRQAWTHHDDLWCSLRVLFRLLRDHETQADGEPLAARLGLPVLDGELFREIALEGKSIANRDLLEALRFLVYYFDDEARTLRRVNYAALDVEELGSVYESLLDNRPVVDQTGSGPAFRFAAGTERKSTGSYYTPRELVSELVTSALEPVLEERLEWARRVASGEWRSVREELRTVLGERDVHRVVSRLGSLAAGHGAGRTGLRGDADVPARGAVRADEPDAPGGRIGAGEHRGGVGAPEHAGVPAVPEHRLGEPSGAGNVDPAGGTGVPHDRSPGSPAARYGADARAAASQPPAPSEGSVANAWASLPLATRYSLLAETAILGINVLDPACGSGHFLLAAARRLAKELARVRTGDDEPSPEAVREAGREVIAHCIYGVDKNPLAVELCKVALWIESQVPGKPLTFLDAHIRCGDSLVGIASLDVLAEGIPEAAYDRSDPEEKKLARFVRERNKRELHQLPLAFDPPEEELLQAAVEFEELERRPDDSVAAILAKERDYQELRRRLEPYRCAADIWTAAFFWNFAGDDRTRVVEQPTAGAVRRARAGGALAPQFLARVESLAERHRFFHWPLEFPDVFIGGGGFDVVLGNPPFMGGLKISGNFGDRYRRWLEVAYKPFGGTADLCAAFYRRAFSLLRPDGRMGMVATNTIGQGDTRESGLAVIIKQGGTITFARRFIKWPGAANVEVNLVGIHKANHSPLAARHSPVLDGQPVDFISSRLDGEPETEPKRLPQNEGKAFIGDYVRGIGFVLEPEEAEALLTKDPRNADCLFPYLNGEDLNSHPEQRPSRWVICFHDWDLERARQYPDLLRIVEERVKPEREKLRDGVSGYERLKRRWWNYAAYAQQLRRAIAPLRRVLVRALTSEFHMMAFVPKYYIFSHALGVFAFDDDYHFALLQSSVHEVWVRKQASSLRADVRYTPTTCFDTFPFPPEECRRVASGQWRVEALEGPFAEAARIGAEYHERRRQFMVGNNLGLTKTYNLFHDARCTDPDIQRLRVLHAEMDRAVLACYGWDDLDPGHGFYENDRRQTRFTLCPQASLAVLRELMLLNTLLAGKKDI